MRPLRCLTGLTFLCVLGVSLAGSAPAARGEQPGGVPSPEAFFGFPMGGEGRLAHWDDIVEYVRLVAEGSDRVAVRELGPTTLGHPYLLVTVSSPETIADLPRYQAMQHQLADPRRTTRETAEAIAADGKAVVVIGANVHATEIGTNQAMNDLLYRLATEESAWVEHVLANTIVLLIPSQNPDGQRMVVEWYRRNQGTPYEGSPLPELYHPYAGHDNNRDSYMLTQVETQYLNQVLYQEWLPEVYLDQHQMGNTGPRIFVPPFQNPPNPNVDPLVWSQVNLLGQAMAAKLHETDKPGVIWGELYSGFWQGANNTNPWWHNMVALLTEVASARLATSVEQTSVGGSRATVPDGSVGSRPARDADLRPLLAPPIDVTPRMSYPRPWLGGRWSLADVVEYQQLATEGLLESVANHKTALKRNFYVMNRRTVERFRDGGPFAYVVPEPAGQRDPAAAVKLLQLLQAEAAEVHVATAPFVADGRAYTAGTHVVPLAQPFGRWIKDVLEPQEYPDTRWPSPGAPRGRPYDVTAWSLGLLMGVDTVRIDRPFEAELTRLDGPVALPPGRVVAAVAPPPATYVFSSASNRSAVAMNRLFDADAALSWAREGFIVTPPTGGAARLAPGAVVARGVPAAVAEAIADELGLTLYGGEPPDDVETLALRRPRLGLFEPWGGNMDAGWTRWVLDQHEFPYRHLRKADLRRPDLAGDLDVIILPEMSSSDLVRGLQGRTVRPEYRGGIGLTGIRQLRAFVRDGGTIVTLGNSAAIAAEHLGAPVRDIVRDLPPDDFLAPGALLSVQVDPTHPIGYGMGSRASAMFVDNGGWVAQGNGDDAVTVVARYPAARLLESGWMIGESQLAGAGAVLEVVLGRGRVILHGFRVQHRGQTWGTFKLLFNSIFYGPAAASATRPATTLDAG